MHVTSIVLGGPTAPWEAVGVVAPGRTQTLAGSVRLEWDANAEPGIVAVGLDDGAALIEGTVWREQPAASPANFDHESDRSLCLVGVDHIVWMTDDLERTCSAIESALTVPLKRVREVGGGVRQGFFRLGSVVLEVVGNPNLPPSTSNLWGLVLNVDDLEGAVDRLGADLLSPPKPAVQRGRLISTVRQSVGLGTAVALMSV